MAAAALAREELKKIRRELEAWGRQETAGRTQQDLLRFRDDPLGFAALCWPGVRLYDRQEEVLRRVVAEPEVFVVAGNMLGKDFVAALCAVWALACHPEARVVTTSVRDDHLRILFGEINRFLDTSAVPLTAERGGPLLVNHREIRKAGCKVSYLVGIVSEKAEGMAGHHAGYTLGVIDEASGVDDVAYTQMATWARRLLVIGNPNACQNFFRAADKQGKALRITAADSPNVRRALGQQASGLEPDGLEVTPGVLSWELYRRRRAEWDAVRQCVGLDAQFYEGADALLFPPEWLNASARRALQLRLQARHGGLVRRAAGLGVDPGEGGDADRLGTAWCVVDGLGVLELVERRTADTSAIAGETKALLRKWSLDPCRCFFDRGGGGKQIADQLRSEGLRVQTVGFGEAPTPDPRAGRVRVAERLDRREDRYAYPSRRCQMYHELRLALDPGLNEHPFAIPAELARLRQELAPIPLRYDKEGRVSLPPKHRQGRRQAGQDKTLTELIGHSPDCADSLVLALHALREAEAPRPRAGGMRGRR